MRKVGQTLLQALPLAGVLDDSVRPASNLSRVAGHDLPVIKHTLWESLSTSIAAKISGEAERLVDGQVGLDHEHGCASDLVLLKHNTTTPVKDTVNTTDGDFRTLELKKKICGKYML